MDHVAAIAQSLRHAPREMRLQGLTVLRQRVLALTPGVEAAVAPIGGLLLGRTSNVSGCAFMLVEGDNVIGTDPESDLMLGDPYVSERHAVVRADARGLSFEDLGSTNGSRVDGSSPVDWRCPGTRSPGRRRPRGSALLGNAPRPRP